MLDLKQVNDDIHQKLVVFLNQRTLEFARYLAKRGQKPDTLRSCAPVGYLMMMILLIV